jgi:Mn2+/Fe2+ NRAMP family transporter
MSKRITFRQGFSSVLLWSVLSAAFIGPGTVTTCSQAGATYHLHLLWALTFSTLAAILLQETAARMTIASGKNLGQIIALKYGGTRGHRIKWALFLAAAFGCAAYQTGNLLGAISGALFFLPHVGRVLLTLLLALGCAALLWSNNFQLLSRALSIMVAVMGIAFIYVAVQVPASLGEWVQHLFVPSFPAGSGLLIIGLVGTTIVPYNLFLGSSIGQNQSLSEMRWGIALAVLIGGIISIAILAAGSLVSGAYSYEALAAALESKMGKMGVAFFGLGLFAAGFSSAITAPLAAAITAQSMFQSQGSSTWTANSRNFRLVWGTVLLIGTLFSCLGIRPIPAIILAQAINGVLLPVVSIALLFVANDADLLGKKYANGLLANVLTLFIVGVTCFLGLNNLWRAANEVGRFLPKEALVPVWVMGGLSISIAVLLALKIFVKPKK